MSKSLGVKRERQVRELLTKDGWIAFRAPASLGVADVVALKAGEHPRLIEVKSDTAGPYHAFTPAKRAALREAATKAGANAYLCWWAPRKEPRWIASYAWPS